MAASDGVVIESPYAGDVAANLAYARACMADSLRRGEYPIASHLLYTQDGILDDTVPAERELGIRAGLYWAAFADLTAVYIDRGISRGMRQGIQHAIDAGRTIELRSIDEDGRPVITVVARMGKPRADESEP